MKKIIVLFMFIITSSLPANSEYNLKYKLVNGDDEIGTMESICQKNRLGRYRYLTRLEMRFSYMFMSYKYYYVEEFFVKNNKVILAYIYENDDGNIKNIEPKIERNFLVYDNGNKVDLDNIDYLPFNIKQNIYEQYIQNRKLKLITFDPINGKLIYEKYNLIKENTNSFSFSIQSNTDTQIRTYDKNGILIYMKNELFEAYLLDKK